MSPIIKENIEIAKAIYQALEKPRGLKGIEIYLRNMGYDTSTNSHLEILDAMESQGSVKTGKGVSGLVYEAIKPPELD